MKSFITILLSLLFLNCFSQHTAEELAYIKEVNLLRSNPKAYLEYVKNYAKNDPTLLKIVETELVPLMDTLSPMQSLRASDEARTALEKNFKGKNFQPFICNW